MIKALFFDIDGTLVSFKSHDIPDSTVKALEEAKSNGIKIYISTGRPYSIINNIDKIKHLIDGYITTNGAFCFIKDEVISCRPIPKEDVNTLINLSDDMQFASMIVGEDTIVFHNPNDEVRNTFQNLLNVKDINLNTDLTTVENQNILQITAFITKDQEEFVMPYMEGSISCRWYPSFADITARFADKGTGLVSIAEHQGIYVSETMAFGDGRHDTSIIMQARIGVAMGDENEHTRLVRE